MYKDSSPTLDISGHFLRNDYSFQPFFKILRGLRHRPVGKVQAQEPSDIPRTRVLTILPWGRETSLVGRSACCSLKRLELCSQHSQPVAHNVLSLPLQGDLMPLLATGGTCVYMHKHIHSHTHVSINK